MKSFIKKQIQRLYYRYNEIEMSLLKEYEKKHKDKLIIYLDICHWIKMRDAIFENKNENYKEIYNILNLLVNEKKTAICPISEAIITELEKQTDKTSFSRTCQIIDTLSNKTCIPEKKLYLLEFENLKRKLNGLPTNSEPTLAPYIFTNRIICSEINKGIVSNGFNNDEALDFWKLWCNYTLEIFCDFKGKNMELSGNYKEIRDNITPLNSTDFYKQLDDMLKGVFETMEKYTDINLPTINIDESGHQNIIDSMKIISKSLLIIAILLASKRTNPDEKFDQNDYYDINHTSAGMGYCDYCFIDKKFYSKLNSSPIKMDFTNCQYEYKEEEILKKLRLIQ